MKKLRLTPAEQEMIIDDIIEKFEGTGRYDISAFEYTKKDVKEFLEALAETNTKKPILQIDETVYTKMYELVKQSSIEIQWHLMVKRDLENQIYKIYDILLFPQINSGTSTSSDQDEFAKWQMELIKDMDFPIDELRGHGHSHVNMNVYSSGIDDAYQRNLITKVEDGDFYIFLVLNKRMEMYALIYDFAQLMVFDTNDIDIQIIAPTGEEIKEWAKEQIKKNCKTAKTVSKTNYYSPSALSLDAYTPKEDELISTMQQAIRKFGRRK